MLADRSKYKTPYQFYLNADIWQTWLPYMLIVSGIELIIWGLLDNQMIEEAKKIRHPSILLTFVPTMGYTVGLCWRHIVLFTIKTLAKKSRLSEVKTTHSCIQALNFYMFFLFTLGTLFTLTAPVSFVLSKPYAPGIFFFSVTWGLRTKNYCLKPVTHNKK